MKALFTSLILLAATAHAGQSRYYELPRIYCTVNDSRITESSGLAASLRSPGSYWTHNDSGDSARFFRFDGNGKVTAEFSLRGVKAVDWEDMASATVSGKRYLYIGDIGDNTKRRSSIKVYRLEEPSGSGAAVTGFDSYELTYPDGARDAEALFVDPATGYCYIVEKNGEGSSGVYRFLPGSTGKHTLQKVGSVSVGGSFSYAKMITGADCSPDGKRIVLRTYLSAYEYTVPASFEKWPGVKPKRITTNVEMQGEAICYSRDGKALLTTSEKRPTPVSILKLKP